MKIDYLMIILLLRLSRLIRAHKKLTGVRCDSSNHQHTMPHEILLYTRKGEECLFNFSEEFRREYQRRTRDSLTDGCPPLMRQDPTCIALVKERGSEWCSLPDDGFSVRVAVIPAILEPYLFFYRGRIVGVGENCDDSIQIIEDERFNEQLCYGGLWPRISRDLLREMLGFSSFTKPTSEDIDRIRAKFVEIHEATANPEILPDHLKTASVPQTDGLNIGSYYARCA